jgi:hypothetical protein
MISNSAVEIRALHRHSFASAASALSSLAIISRTARMRSLEEHSAGPAEAICAPNLTANLASAGVSAWPVL